MGEKPKFEIIEITPRTKKKEEPIDSTGFAECPVCKKQTLQVEGGCVTCMNPECGYSKCDV